MNTKFDQWLLTEKGIKCSNDKVIIKNPYLTNRLFYAFDAGSSNNLQYVNMKNKLDELFIMVGKLRKTLKIKNREIEKLKLELKKEPKIHLFI